MKLARLLTLFFSLLPCLAIVLFTADKMGAQEYRGRVQGTVSDSSEALVVAAAVALRNTKTGVSTIRTTDTTGHYLFDLVEPGNYTVAVEVQGFNRFVRENILVENRSDLTVDAILQVGGAAETVTISESPVALKFNTTTMELTMDNTMVKNLPIVARNTHFWARMHNIISVCVATYAFPFLPLRLGNRNKHG